MWSIPPTFSKYKHLWRVASWLCLAGSGGLKARRGTEAGGDLLGPSLLVDVLCSCMSVLVFQKFQAKIDQDWGIGQSLGTKRARSTKMNYAIDRYYTTEWCCIKTAGCSGLQFDPCSLIPRNILFSAVAFCSSFVYWIICHYTCSVIHNVFCFSTALLVATSTKSKWSTKRQLPSVCSHFFPSRGRPGKSNKRWFAWLQCLMICDSILFGTHPMYLLASVYTCLHTWFLVSSLGRWEDP